MKCQPLIEQAYETACKHGFHDMEFSNEHWLMLAITEVSEMVEADRKCNRADIVAFNERVHVHPNIVDRFEAYIKDTVEDEMADICIRLFDLAGVLHTTIDIEESFAENHVQSFKKNYEGLTFSEIAFQLCLILTLERPTESVILIALKFIFCWCRLLGIDLEWHIVHKMSYNATRANKHGKKY